MHLASGARDRSLRGSQRERVSIADGLVQRVLDFIFEEKTRNGILSTLRTAAKLAPLGILTGILSNKHRPIGSHSAQRPGST